MPTVTISERTFEALSRIAESRNTTADALVAGALDQLAQSTPALPPTGEDWRRAFEQFNAAIRRAAPRYPAGHRLDDGREAIYEDRLRGQL